MKTNKTLILTSLIALVCAVFIFSCDIPLALGTRLDVEGPVVEFTSPAPRTAVPEQFVLEGRVSDENSIKELLIKTSMNNLEFAKQWRYTRSAGWQVTEDYGTNWTEYPDAQWNGTEKSASWVVPIDLSINGISSEDGEYMFTAQAWDTGGWSDDKSLKTLVLIFDTDPPRVEVYNPYLYSRYASYNKAGDTFGEANDSEGIELQSLRDKADWREPALLGKFLTQEFQLQWQIEDNHDIDSIELLFYEHNVDIDGIEETGVPQNYIYSYTGTNKPNGSVWVPHLSGDARQYNETMYDGGTIRTPLLTKTTVKVVALCYDAAGHVNQEKVLGYFIFWPEAAEPWITFTDGMNPPEFYTDASYSGNFEEDTFSIYPGRSIKATAFQAQGVSKVEFSLHFYDAESKEITGTMPLSYLERAGVVLDYADDAKTSLRIRAEERPNGGYSTIFPWDFMPPPRSGNYAVRARAFDFNETPSAIYYEAVFIVKDITFPDFPVPPAPAASNPLFESIENNKITISGIVSDATEIESLYFVWINPQSRSYAAMSQLSYFRDANYRGWRDAVLSDLADGESMEDNTFDPLHRNRVWKVAVEYIGEDNGTKWNARDSWAENGKLDKWDIWEGDIEPTYRQLFYYELEIDITEDLNIAGVGPAAAALGKNQPLTSQVFLFRAGNPDGKCTIITYTPQGDTLSPSIAIQEVRVLRDGSPDVVCLPREFIQVPQFKAGDRIRVSGTWREDSTEYLPIQTYLTPNMEFEINGVKVPGTLTPGTGLAASGTFLIDIIVTESGGVLNLPNMKDTLVVNATVKDVGGNPAETGSSWLIESDTLRFLRISSLNEDKAYKAGDKIEIFLEFNKPVTLKNPGSNPVLTLNTTGSTGTASYRTEPPQTNESTRHYFTYTVGSSENTPVNKNLNVNGLSGGAAWQEDAYPFTWVHNGLQGSKEEIRITMTSGHNGVLLPDGFYARALPVTDDPDDSDYPFTLIGGKRITVDNQTPTITSFSASPQGWHGVGTDIYITASFSEPVKLGTVTPYLILNTGGSSPGDRTSTDAADIRVNNKQITFRYTVKAGDNTGTSQLQVTDFGGQVLDIPGTPMAPGTGSLPANKTLTGVYLDTAAPSTPTVAVFSGTIANPGTQITGTIPATLYHDHVFIRVTAGTDSTAGDNINLGRVEYSLNNGQDWTSSTSATINEELLNKGSYTIHARQTDQAGNVSGTSSTTTFTWDPGSLITRISSTRPNGTYTHNSGFGNGNLIPITVYFRKPVSISAVSGITLNAIRGVDPGTDITVSTVEGGLPRNDVTSLTFNYTVQDETATGSNNGDRMPAGTNVWLNVTGLGTITATDGVNSTSGVNVSSHFAMPASGSSLLLNENKEIRVETGALINTATTFIADAQGGDGWDSEANANFHGIRSDDGSYWTTLDITFNHNISKGSGDITIEQIAANYRLPTVLTEAQYNRFRGIANFNTYYTRGTNGYTYTSANNQGADTSAKYVLNYQWNPDSAVTVDNSAFPNNPTNANNGDRFIPATFFTAFRTEERITINVNSQAVEIEGSTLKVRLTGSNAPQVPGATYAVTVPAGSVNDTLGNSNTVINASVNLGGVAKPFVRIRKTQDTINNGTPSANAPRLLAAQPRYAYVRMDSRTPGATIQYTATEHTYTATDNNWSTSGGPNYTNTTVVSNNDTITNPATTGLTRPLTPATTFSNNNMAIPTTTNETGIRGYKWWVRARATVGGVNSLETEEMAYRTAITYRLRSDAANGAEMAYPQAATGNNNSEVTSGQQRVGGGDQIWIRGGDAIGSSTIPGFPFTWEDDWTSLQSSQKRAGIRLMTLRTGTPANSTPATAGTASLNNSTWEFMTWDMNATAYVDFILGRDGTTFTVDNNGAISNVTVATVPLGTARYDVSSNDEAWQYGPRLWAYNRGGWTGSKTQYPIYPGEHRWLDIGQQTGGVPINFSSVFNSRPDLTNNVMPGANTN
jgi:hypothetical protein